MLDSFFLPLVLPRRITYVGKAEYMDDWKTKYLFPALGMIPIDRSGRQRQPSGRSTPPPRVLERGELFGIYPEGTRARDGQLHRGHTGPARLALRTGAPIVPGRASSAPARSSRPTPSCPKPFKPVEVPLRPADRRAAATPTGPTTASSCARSSTR